LAAPKSMVGARDRLGNYFPTVWGQYKEEYMFFK